MARDELGSVVVASLCHQRAVCPTQRLMEARKKWKRNGSRYQMRHRDIIFDATMYWLIIHTYLIYSGRHKSRHLC